VELAVGGRHAGDLALWNQKGADTDFFLIAGKARSYSCRVAPNVKAAGI
jgi:hypothetical protein